MTGTEQPDPPQDGDSAGDPGWLLLVACFVVATSASLGSLFFSEIMELPPCSLCWYQRIFMFPLAIVLMVGALSNDLGSVRYALPLAIGGWLVALYHVLVQAGIIEESMAPCQQGISCADAQLTVFGFASIPVMSLLGFSALVAGLITIRTKYAR